MTTFSNFVSSISYSSISEIIVSIVYEGFHFNSYSSSELLPMRCGTSPGRKNYGSIVTRTRVPDRSLSLIPDPEN